MNKYFVIFILVSALAIGSILVYTKNNIKSPSLNSVGGQLSKINSASSNTNPQSVTESVSNVSPTAAVTSAPVVVAKKITSCDNMDKVTDLKIEDITVGSGATVKKGDTVSVGYLGTFMDGTKFDASADHGNQPFSFQVGAGHVIQGWDEGLIGMKVGGKRKLTIPPDLAYGENGAPPSIPANCSLMFEIELSKIN